MLTTNLTSTKSNVDAFLLCSFLGIFGAHRLYVGKYSTALIQLFTFGGFYIWTIIDLISILQQKFLDSHNKTLTWNKEQEGEYAGFKIRLAAHIMDSFIIISSCFVMFHLVIPFLIKDNNPISSLLYELEEFIKISMSTLYYIILTASEKQATVGKNIVGIIVVDYNKKAISLAQSVGRCFAYYFSYITLGIGFLMIIFTKKHTALHDKIAQTYVIYGRR